MTCIKARSVEVDVDQKCGQAAQHCPLNLWNAWGEPHHARRQQASHVDSGIVYVVLGIGRRESIQEQTYRDVETLLPGSEADDG
jgi:hypothetical protein